MEPVFRPEFQSHGQQTQRGVAGGGHCAYVFQWLPDDSGIVKHRRRPKDRPHGSQGDAGKQRDHERPVPVVEAVDGKCRPSPKQTAPGTHGVGFQRQCGDHPRDQHGENPQAVDKSSKNISLIASPADALLSQVDFSCLPADSRNKAQQNCEKQRQPWADPAEQVQHLVAGHHPEQAAQPHAHCRRPQSRHHAVHEAFHRQVVADEVLFQHRHAEMVIAAVIQGEANHQRQQAQVEDNRPLSVPLHAEREGAQAGDGEKHRVLEGHASVNDGGKKQEVHRRMAAFKAHLRPPSSRTAPSPGPAFPAKDSRKSPWSGTCRRPD